MITDDNVPSATATVIGPVGLTFAAPLAGFAVSFAGGAGGLDVGELDDVSPVGVLFPTGEVAFDPLLCPDEHAPSTKTPVAATAATNPSRRTPIDTPTSGLARTDTEDPTDTCELNCGPRGRHDTPS
ncbi:MAG TPA: hypothetical protein VGL21_17815 [Jatrophihabitantaceae bacterium]